MSLVVPFGEIFAGKTGLISNHPSWNRIELGDICGIVNGFPFNSALFNKEKGFPVVRIRDLGKDDTETRYNGEVPNEVIINNGDLLVGMDGIFRCCKWKGDKAGLNQRVCKLLPDERYLDRKFLLFGINGYLKAIQDATSSVTVGHLSSHDILRIPFPIPPLNEQQRIVAKLETLMGKVDTCQKRLESIPVLLRRFRQAILAAACTGRLTADWRKYKSKDEVKDAQRLLDQMKIERQSRHDNLNGKRKYIAPMPIAKEELSDIPLSWCWTNFDHCTWEITVGHVGPMKDQYTSTGVPFLRSQNVRPLRFDLEGLVQIPNEFHTVLSKSKLEGGEILVVRSGANTGDCCVFPRTFGEANCADLVISRPLSGLCAEYGALYICSPDGQARLDLKQTGIAQPHFNIGAMRVKAFPLPPLEEQLEIVRRVEALFKVTKRIEESYNKAKAHINRLTQSLLAKTFRGELVSQDPNDESASMLLERIQREKTQRTEKDTIKTMRKRRTRST